MNQIFVSGKHSSIYLSEIITENLHYSSTSCKFYKDSYLTTALFTSFYNVKTFKVIKHQIPNFQT